MVDLYAVFLARALSGGSGFKPTEEQLNAINSGITSAKVAEFEAKQDALTTAQLNAVNSGITADKVTQFEGKQNALNASQLNAVNSGITSAKVTQFEGKQDALSTSQLNAVNSGITASTVQKLILSPVSAPAKPTLLGVDTANAESQFTMGVGLGTDESTSPFAIDVKGVSYLTTAPTSANTSGSLIAVVLSSEPTTKYNGYIYYITE